MAVSPSGLHCNLPIETSNSVILPGSLISCLSCQIYQHPFPQPQITNKHALVTQRLHDRPMMIVPAAMTSSRFFSKPDNPLARPLF